MRRAPPPASDASRTADEAAVVELLLLHGWAFEARGANASEARAKAAEALQGLIDRGLPCRTAADGGRGFDPTEVVNALAWSNLQRLDPALARACLANGRALAWQTSGAEGPLAAPPPVDPAAPRRVRVRLERRFELADRRGRLRLRLPAPIEDGALDELEINVITPRGLTCEVRAAPAQVDVLVEAADAAPLTVALEARFRSRPQAPAGAPAPLPETEAELYTRPSEGLIRVSPAVDALAKRLAVGASDPAALVRRIWDFVFDEMCCGAIRYEALDPARPLDFVLEHGWFDCQLGAALIAAVCRARGVPARLAGGYALCAASPFPHYWAEIWLDDRGWTPFDLWGWDLSRGGADRAWRDMLFGRLDCRMTTQRLPRLFSGGGSMRLPKAWRILPRATAGGVETTVFDATSGASLYCDRLEVKKLDAVSPA